MAPRSEIVTRLQSTSPRGTELTLLAATRLVTLLIDLRSSPGFFDFSNMPWATRPTQVQNLPCVLEALNAVTISPNPAAAGQPGAGYLEPG